MTIALPDANLESLRKVFRGLADEASDDPLINPVSALSSRLFLALENRELSVGALARALREFECAGFEKRASFLTENLQVDDAERRVIDDLRNADFDDFQKQIEADAVGAVFTAHPTFAITNERRKLITQFQEADRQQWRDAVRASESGPPKNISLQIEHDDVLNTIQNAQDGVAALNRQLLEIAKERFPDRWRKLRPKTVSLASWVGYDLDGRTDIHWGQSVTIRLREKATQLARYSYALANINAKAENHELQEVVDILSRAQITAAEHAEMFSGDLSDPAVVVPAANALTEKTEGRLTSLAPIIEKLSSVIGSVDDETALALMIVRAEMDADGLGVSRIHLRVNAAQVRSALRFDFGLDPDKEFQGRSALEIASAKARVTQKRLVNFGSVFREQMTARRQFMLCAQFLKHIDSDIPIRFLIAECEAPATVMGAIYLAKLYGVDEKLDISPLFETPTALEGGGRFIERLLDEEVFRDYAQKRKRMAIQIGYSDSGRFMGQATASLAAERLQVLFSRALHKAGLGDVEALVFNTHGESMGRGAFPGGYRARMAHLSTPWVRSGFQRFKQKFVTEFSFQGGEGYLHFQTPDCARHAVGSLWAIANERLPQDRTDLFYEDINFSWDVYRSLKTWQESLFDRPDYRDVIFSFAQNLLFKTGSREVKRPRQGAAGVPPIRSIRAIPHNAILQQLGIPVNVSGGLGTASRREQERFIEMVNGSNRMREILRLVGRARDLTSISILRAYALLFAPSYWSALAGMTRGTQKAETYESVLQGLQQSHTASAFSRLSDFLARDLRDFDVLRDSMKMVDRGVNGAGIDSDLGVLHAIRQALIGRGVALVAGAPDFSRRHDIGRNDIIELALELRLREAAQTLQKIFPKESPDATIIDGISETVDDDRTHGGAYPEIHDTIIDPLCNIADALDQVSAAIANHYCAFG